MKFRLILIILTLFFISPFSQAQNYPLHMQKYLLPGKYINSNHPSIIAKVKELIGNETDLEIKAKIIFEFVRDQIREGYINSMFASDVLAKAEGVCYEKATLLAALARAAGIPAYYGYTVVEIKKWKNDKGQIADTKFLHGVTGLYLKGKWILYDPTGNIHRWKMWVQDDPIQIKLPLEFSSDHDVLFPSTNKVFIQKIPHKLFEHNIYEFEKINLLYGIRFGNDVHKYLEPMKYINSNHPEIIAKVKEMVGDETNPVKKAKTLFEFVRDKIREGFINSMFASDVLAKAEGNGSEKASLFAALARAAEIPAYYGYTVIKIKNWRNKNGQIIDRKFLHGATGLYLNGKWIHYEPTGSIQRWKRWVQGEPVKIKLPLEFSSKHDVLFPSVGRVFVHQTPFMLLDHDMDEKRRIGQRYGIKY